MSSSRTNPHSRWNAIELLGIINPDGLSFTCVGYAPSAGRRCRKEINQRNKDTALAILQELPEFCSEPMDMNAQLQDLASLCLCRQYHQNQADEVARQWKKKILQTIGSCSRSATDTIPPKSSRPQPTPDLQQTPPPSIDLHQLEQRMSRLLNDKTTAVLDRMDSLQGTMTQALQRIECLEKKSTQTLEWIQPLEGTTDATLERMDCVEVTITKSLERVGRLESTMEEILEQMGGLDRKMAELIEHQQGVMGIPQSPGKILQPTYLLPSESNAETDTQGCAEESARQQEQERQEPEEHQEPEEKQESEEQQEPEERQEPEVAEEPEEPEESEEPQEQDRPKGPEVPEQEERYKRQQKRKQRQRECNRIALSFLSCSYATTLLMLLSDDSLPLLIVSEASVGFFFLALSSSLTYGFALLPLSSLLIVCAAFVGFVLLEFVYSWRSCTSSLLDDFLTTRVYY